MIARFTGGTLGLLAFTITIIAGVYVGNPVMVTLSRSIWALLVFCCIGLVLGAAAGLVLREHEVSRKREILQEFREDATKSEDEAAEDQAPGEEPATVGA